MVSKEVKFVPQIKGTLRNHVIEVPTVIRNCGGIKIFGKRIKSLLFSTDVALIKIVMQMQLLQYIHLHHNH